MLELTDSNKFNDRISFSVFSIFLTLLSDEICSKNLCNICLEERCKEHKYKLLYIIPDRLKFYKDEIEKIIEKNFIKPKKKKENGEKEQRSYQVIDENKIIDESFKKLEYTNDIILISLIIRCNSNNYFHPAPGVNAFCMYFFKFIIRIRVFFHSISIPCHRNYQT